MYAALIRDCCDDSRVIEPCLVLDTQPQRGRIYSVWLPVGSLKVHFAHFGQNVSIRKAFCLVHSYCYIARRNSLKEAILIIRSTWQITSLGHFVRIIVAFFEQNYKLLIISARIKTTQSFRDISVYLFIMYRSNI